MGAMLVETLISGDGTTASLAELLDVELRPSNRTGTVRAQVRPATVVEYEHAPHLFIETSPDGAAWSELADVGDVPPGYVGEESVKFPTGGDVRLRWELAPSEDTGSSWLRVWLGGPRACYR
jgi:hypothetical protein